MRPTATPHPTGAVSGQSPDAFGTGWRARIGQRLAGAGTALFVCFFLLLLASANVGIDIVAMIAVPLYVVGIPLSLVLDWAVHRRFATYPVVPAHGLAGLLVALGILGFLTPIPTVIQEPGTLIILAFGTLAGTTAALAGIHLRDSMAATAAIGAPTLVTLIALT